MLTFTISKGTEIVFRDQAGRGQLGVSLLRTLRLPDDGVRHPLPPGMGPLPVRRVADLAGRVPAGWLAFPGVVVPMYRCEAVWLLCSVDHPLPHAIKVGCGGINALSGQPMSRQLARPASPGLWHRMLGAVPAQDYAVCPPQQFIDGFNTGHQSVRQFVAVPLGEGKTVEEQLTGQARHGGIQLCLYPPRRELEPALAHARRRGLPEVAAVSTAGSPPGAETPAWEWEGPGEPVLPPRTAALPASVPAIQEAMAPPPGPPWPRPEALPPTVRERATAPLPWDRMPVAADLADAFGTTVRGHHTDPGAQEVHRCPSCGSDAPPMALFCGTCGSRLSAAPMPGAMPMQLQAPRPGRPMPAHPGGMATSAAAPVGPPVMPPPAMAPPMGPPTMPAPAMAPPMGYPPPGVMMQHPGGMSPSGPAPVRPPSMAPPGPAPMPMASMPPPGPAPMPMASMPPPGPAPMRPLMKTAAFPAQDGPPAESPPTMSSGPSSMPLGSAPPGVMMQHPGGMSPSGPAPMRHPELPPGMLPAPFQGPGAASPEPSTQHVPHVQLAAERPMGLGAGGQINQRIYADPYGIETWDEAACTELFIHIVSPQAWYVMTGEPPPPTPVTYRAYQAAGLPWFQIYDEELPGLGPSPALAQVRSIDELERARHGK
jgi:hypothetical protein